MSATAEVTVWTASALAAQDLAAAGALDADERRRAGTISHPGEHARFVASRALLRHAMSEASGGSMLPERWRFQADSRGKPAVAEGLPPLTYSLSHAGDCVAVATGGVFPVGVDAEGLWREPGSEIVPDVLTDAEKRAFSSLDEEARWKRFVRIWTVKESCAKALGEGTAMDFTAIEVELDPLAACVSRGLPRGAAFALHAQEIAVAGRCYHVAVAAIVGAPGAARFRSIAL